MSPRESYRSANAAARVERAWMKPARLSAGDEVALAGRYSANELGKVIDVRHGWVRVLWLNHRLNGSYRTAQLRVRRQP